MQAEGHISKYAIAGAVGATFYLEPSATEDIDILVVLPLAPGSSLLSLTPVYDFLKGLGLSVQGERIMVGDWLVQFLPAHGDLDREALDEAVVTEVEGVITYVPSAEHLIALALRTGRAKDYARVVQFVEQNAFDTNELNRILMRHGLVDKWERFERRYLGE